MRLFPIFISTIICFCTIANAQNCIFSIGKPDGSATEFKFFRGLDDEMFYPRKFRDLDGAKKFFKNPPAFVVGQSKDRNWSFIHPIKNCSWAGINQAPTYKIIFDKPNTKKKKLFLKIGLADSCVSTNIGLAIKLNGTLLKEKLAFFSKNDFSGTLAFHKDAKNTPSKPFTLPIETEKFIDGKNTIELTAIAGKNASTKIPLWLVYDFIELSETSKYPTIADYKKTLLERAIKAMGTEEIVFSINGSSRGGHWYENIGTICQDDTDHPQIKSRQGAESFSRLGGRLVRFNIKTGAYKVLLEDKVGGIRDPHVHYNGKKIVFSYRKGTSDTYQLYEIDADGKNLKKLPINTNSNDIEPCYLPNDDIMYVSDRMNRTVQCWMTPTVNLHRYFRKENAVVCMSGNPDVDNTPNVLKDGRVAYMRWDYNHRNQVVFHHLWSINPDGSNNAILFGNSFENGVFLNPRQPPDKDDIIFTLSWGHGRRDSRGAIARLTPPFDPSDPYAMKLINPPHRSSSFFEPYPLRDNMLICTDGNNIVIMDYNGVYISIPIPYVLFTTTQESFSNSIDYDKIRIGGKCTMIARSASPLVKRERENIRPDMANYHKKTAEVFLQDVYEGRHMKGVKRGTIKKLLITQVQPAPVNYHGGYAPTGFAGTFALEEVLGTVPVYEDGSAFFEVPAMVGVAFCALDENDNCVKRMMSSTNFASGTSTSCVGCHENRTAAPPRKQKVPIAYKKGVSKIAKLDGAKNIIDFTRDIQPLLDKYCVGCHNSLKPTGGVILSFGVGKEHINSRLVLQANNMCASDNNLMGNLLPYKFGSGASKLAKFADGGHHNKKFSKKDAAILKAWLDTGSAHISTYAAKGTGFPIKNRLRTRVSLIRGDNPVYSVEAKKCASCHFNRKTGGGRWAGFVFDSCHLMRVKTKDGKVKQLKFPREALYNYIDPENSTALLVPLAKAAGGSAANDGKSHPIIFKDKNDAFYKQMLSGVQQVAKDLEKDNPFITSKNFRPSFGYVKQMQKCKILPENWNPKTPLDAYEIDNKYFRWQENNIVKFLRAKK